MKSFDIKTIEDIVPHAREHLLPEIHQAVEACQKAYWDNEFNDMWTFGTHLWKNTWNRFKSVAEYDDCPFEVWGKGNEYKLRIGPFVVRHHRIDEETKLPNGAKGVKSAATYRQMGLFGDKWAAPVEVENIVLAVDADTKNGLKEVFIGELIPHGPESKKYIWENKVTVFLADGFEDSSEENIRNPNMIGSDQQAPPEKVPEMLVEREKTGEANTGEGESGR